METLSESTEENSISELMSSSTSSLPSNEELDEQISIFDIVGDSVEFSHFLDRSVFKVISRAWVIEKMKRAGRKIDKVINVKELSQRMSSEPFLRAKDKFAFISGVLTLMVTEAILIVYPQYLYFFYTLLFVPLLAWRFVSYHKHKWHYFMLDYCYYANMLTLMWLYVWPSNLRFFKMVLSLTTGPLLLAVIMWSNSLVFHDLNRTTSLFIHFFPPLIFYIQRWYPNRQFNYPSEVINSLTYYEGIFLPMLFYTLWQIFYLLKTEVLDRDIFSNDEEMLTSARWLSRVKPHKIYLILKKFNVNIPPNILLPLFQLFYTLIFLIPVHIVYKIKHAHTALLLLLFIFAIWNGANYYFDIFSENYTQRLQYSINVLQKNKSGPLPSSFKSVLNFIAWFFTLVNAVVLCKILTC